MRRLYESKIGGDEHYSFTNDDGSDRSARPQAARSVPSGLLSSLFVPDALHRRAISVSVSTPQSTYPVGRRIPFYVEMRNTYPFPVSVTTNSPMLWTWFIDGKQEASEVPLRDPPDERGTFSFNRGERKQFRKVWNGTFKRTEMEWKRATPGEYTIGAGFNVDDPESAGLYDETTVELVPDG